MHFCPGTLLHSTNATMFYKGLYKVKNKNSDSHILIKLLHHSNPYISFSQSPKVSVQGFVALSRHFALFCEEVEFYEAFFFHY